MKDRPMRWPRLRLRTLLVLVACSAIGSWVWVAHLSSVHRWHRAIRSDNESAARWEAASRAIAGRIAGVDPDEAISALISALDDGSPRVRETAASTLGAAGPKARPAIPRLIVALKDVDFAVRRSAAESLGALAGRGEGIRIAIPGLIGALRDANSSVRRSAAESLGALAGRDVEARKVAEPELVGALDDPSPDVRIAAGFELSLMGRCESAVPVMNAAVREGEDRAGYAALALGLCGSRDEAAVEALKMALGSSSGPIRRAAADALKRPATPGPESDR